MINFYAPINYLGYGIHAYNLMKAYSMFNENISLTPPFGRVIWKDSYVDTWMQNREKISTLDAGIMIFNEPYLSQFSGAKRIGFPVFEMEKFPALSITMMKTCDWLLTPSKWGKEVLEKELNWEGGIDVIPEGYDPEVFYPDYSLEYKLNRIEEQGLTFVHIGKWEERKGTKDILKVFLRAFQGSKRKVTLIILASNPFNPNWMLEAKKCLEPHVQLTNVNDLVYSKDNVTIIVPGPRDRTFKEMANLYRNADFGIWLSKAEGWNLPLMECIACGTPAITTTWTGMSEYLGDYPRELKLEAYDEEIANDGVWFRGNRGTWKKPKLDQVYELLKAIGEDPEKYLWLEGKCKQSIEKFTWHNAAKKLSDTLQRLGIEGGTNGGLQ